VEQVVAADPTLVTITAALSLPLVVVTDLTLIYRYSILN